MPVARTPEERMMKALLGNIHYDQYSSKRALYIECTDPSTFVVLAREKRT
jgi:hypothetical protein